MARPSTESCDVMYRGEVFRLHAHLRPRSYTRRNQCSGRPFAADEPQEAVSMLTNSGRRAHTKGRKSMGAWLIYTHRGSVL